MLDGSENAVTGLLAHLFATEGVEMPHPTHEEPQRHPVLAAAPPQAAGHKPEQNAQVLAAIEAFKAAKASGHQAAIDHAFSVLMDTEGDRGETANQALAKAVGSLVARSVGTGQIDHAGGDDIKQDSLDYMAKRIACSEKGCYDPAKSRFNAWATTVVQGRAQMQIRAKTSRKETGTGDDTDLDRQLSRHRASSSGPSTDFDEDEAKLCVWLTSYMKKVKDGTEPFPIPLNAPLKDAGGTALPHEARVKLRQKIAQARILTFMHSTGLGLEKKTWPSIQELVAQLGLPGPDAFNQRKWNSAMWPYIKTLVFVSAREIGLKGDPEAVFASFKDKLSLSNRRGASHGTFACEDELSAGLTDLLAVLEGWHAPANG